MGGREGGMAGAVISARALLTVDHVCREREPVPQHGEGRGGREGNMGGASIIIGEFALPSSRAVLAEAGCTY